VRDDIEGELSAILATLAGRGGPAMGCSRRDRSGRFSISRISWPARCLSCAGRGSRARSCSERCSARSASRSRCRCWSSRMSTGQMRRRLTC
jgi:hypothetical protein